ncbi:hypothetical protein D3C78_844060 [compost metagenome]
MALEPRPKAVLLAPLAIALLPRAVAILPEAWAPAPAARAFEPAAWVETPRAVAFDPALDALPSATPLALVVMALSPIATDLSYPALAP